ncbi:MAG: succinoglycan biosynthesis protein ExoA [Chloroflexota bacterium]|nr:succinoglycan biosynthesis protein ExoA [Chloroflexota bacterium]
MQPTTEPDIEVSVIVPCYNEGETIQLLLQALLEQTYPSTAMEVVIADALSSDDTRAKIAQFSEKNPELRIVVVDNPRRTIPAAVNAAAAAAKGVYLVRMDAHSVPDPAYVATSVQLLKEGRAENVGGVWEIAPGEDTCIAKAIAAAASHPLGAGDALYRIAKKAAYVETVPFGAFSKQVFDQVGRFDESLLSNEDYEFNARIHLNGGKVWLDPRIRSRYFARKNLGLLASQYWRYGFWKLKMLKRYPKTIRWRQAIPPLFVLGVIILSILSVFLNFARIILACVLGVYFAVLMAFSLREAIRKKDQCYLLMFLAITVMHFSWGMGFLYSAIDLSREA